MYHNNLFKVILATVILSFAGAGYSSDDSNEEEEKVIITLGCGTIAAQPESFKSQWSEGFNLIDANDEFIFYVDHENLYLVDQKSLKLVNKLAINSGASDWIFDLKFKNRILAVVGFSKELQANKIIRFRLNSYGLRKIDEFWIEYTQENSYQDNTFTTPLVANDKAVFVYNVSINKDFKIYQISGAGKALYRDIYLKNHDNKNHERLVLFADLFKDKLHFRELLTSFYFSLQNHDDRNLYDLVDYEAIEDFTTKFSSYPDYFAYASEYALNNKVESKPYSYLVTLNLNSERLKIRPFKAVISTGWELELGVNSGSNIFENRLEAYFDSDEYSQLLEFDSAWNLQRQTLLFKDESELDISLNTNGKQYFIVPDDWQEKKLNTNLYYLNKFSNNLEFMELNHSTNSLKYIGDYLLSAGNSLGGSLSFSIIRASNNQLITSKVIDDFVSIVNAFEGDEQFLDLGQGRYVILTTISKASEVEKDGFAFEPLDDTGNGYYLSLEGLSKGQVEHLDLIPMDLDNNRHCQSYCDDEYYWDNRKIIIKNQSLILLLGTKIKLLEFDKQFNYTEKLIDLSQTDGA